MWKKHGGPVKVDIPIPTSNNTTNGVDKYFNGTTIIHQNGESGGNHSNSSQNGHDNSNGIIINSKELPQNESLDSKLCEINLEDDDYDEDSMMDNKNQDTNFNSLKLRLNNSSSTNTTIENCQLQEISSATKSHPLWLEVDKITLEQLHYAKLDLGEGAWSLFAKEGEMRMYKREEEIDGLIVDPLKAVHKVKGVTAHEVCHYFFSPEFRYEWETTLEKMTVLEKISDDTMIFLQIHKRVWPATQRDALFWSHIRQVPCSSDNNPEDLAQATWIVCNHSAKHSKDVSSSSGGDKKSTGKYIRIFLTVSLVCDTKIEPSPKNDEPITRDNLTCHINYCSVVNPGGWAPGAGLRAIYKREYPRFLKKFTQYVIDKCKDQPIMF